MSKANFPVNPVLTAIVIAYRNRRMIADQVLPRSDVGKQEFKYLKHDLGEGFTVPKTIVGRTARPNQVEFSATELTASTEDHALDAPVPVVDVKNAPANYDPDGRAVEQTINLIDLAREVRAANLVFNKQSYANGLTKTLSGNDQWTHEQSDPIRQLLDALDTPIMRPNIMVLGQKAATALRTNKAIVKAYNGTLGDSGLVPLEFLRELFELDNIFVGQTLVNTINKDRKPILAKAWGGHCALIYRDVLADTQHGTTFGLTAQFGKREVRTIFDEDIGYRGGNRHRVGESVKELITAPDLGYFLENVIA
ncbi:phage capsid protein [Pasteurella canis]|uniref:phage capsid protein n=1 Tax=Pasteurella TaxID=745 RepID=UPI001E4106E7|nr:MULTISPECIES: phage capsid protein [Pasteurella]MEB3496518.1 phage capsid protein [Pasteurella multocida]UEA17795.1 phage capsid protein [Pasteurella canis]